MHLDKYKVTPGDDHNSYEFYSEGPKGLIKKIIFYKRLPSNQNVFNLGFGDWDEKTRSVNDKVESNNNDRDKILATVAATILDFTARNPGTFVYAEGSTPSRTRLYQMGIKTHWREITKQFNIYGYSQSEWEIFHSNKNYEAFVVTLKKNL